MFWVVITRESGQRFKSLQPSPNLNPMLNVNLSALSMSELKALAATNNVVPTGDKRAKQSWIDALELICACESDAEMEAIAHTADMAKEIIDRLEELSNAPDNETEAKARKKGAATVFGALLIAVVVMVRAMIEIGTAIYYLASWAYQSSKPITQAIKSIIESKPNTVAVSHPSIIMHS
jgi:CHASE3 domain sensor protein